MKDRKNDDTIPHASAPSVWFLLRDGKYFPLKLGLSANDWGGFMQDSGFKLL